MRDRFNEQLEQLNVELIKMGALCEEAISAATKALLDGDDALRESAAAAEREIDQKERDIENLCMKLLLQQQPVARDLRAISAALKMISDMDVHGAHRRPGSGHCGDHPGHRPQPHDQPGAHR